MYEEALELENKLLKENVYKLQTQLNVTSDENKSLKENVYKLQTQLNVTSDENKSLTKVINKIHSSKIYRIGTLIVKPYEKIKRWYYEKKNSISG